MANRLLIDTWGWLTLHDAGERQHTEVNIQQVLTEDVHFTQVGLQFERIHP